MSYDSDEYEDDKVFESHELLFDVSDSDGQIEIFMDEADAHGEPAGNDSLGSHNVRGLPVYVNTHEDSECQWSLKRGESVSKDQLIMDMVFLGFRYHQGMIDW